MLINLNDKNYEKTKTDLCWEKNRGRRNAQSKIIGSILFSLHKLCVLYISELRLQIVHQVGCKQILSPLQCWSLINVTGKFRHMPQALVSINTSPGEIYLDWQAAALLKTLNCEKRDTKWKEVRKMSLELSLSCAFPLHRCAAESVQLADWQMGKNSPIWAGR